jgi:hypothetical protein
VVRLANRDPDTDPVEPAWEDRFRDYFVTQPVKAWREGSTRQRVMIVFLVAFFTLMPIGAAIGAVTKSPGTPTYAADSSGTPSASSGPEQYVADLAFTTADDVVCEDAGVAGKGSEYFCGVSSTYNGQKDYTNPPTCYHVFPDNTNGSGWSAYSGGSPMEAPAFCPSYWGWSTVG